MAIYSSVPPPEQATLPSTTIVAPEIDIETWTVNAIQSLSVSSTTAGTGVTLSIPLDAPARKRSDDEEKDARRVHTVHKRREPIRRDSIKKREALLKGKEGSRRRQRWENDQLLNVPNAQPPLPSDWAPQPTHRVNHIPYYLAPLWDAGVRHRAEEIASQKRNATAARAGYSTNSPKGRVPQDLKQKLKKSQGAKTLLQDLELEIRKFVKEYEVAEHKLLNKEKESEDGDSEDEEIVFIGRDKNGEGITMSDEVKDVMEEELEREKKVYEGLAGTPEGGFARWLVHCVADYYGLSSRSVTVGVRREAYVGIKDMKSGRDVEERELPRPLWGLI